MKPISVGLPRPAEGSTITAEVTISNTSLTNRVDGMILPSEHMIDKKLCKKQYPVTRWQQIYEYLLSDYFLIETISLLSPVSMLIYINKVLIKC